MNHPLNRWPALHINNTAIIVLEALNKRHLYKLNCLVLVVLTIYLKVTYFFTGRFVCVFTVLSILLV